MNKEVYIAKFLVFFFLLSLGPGLSAQKRIPPHLLRDTVYHKSELIYYGIVIRYKRNENVVLKGPRGQAVRFELNHVDSIGWSEKSKSKFIDELVKLDSIETVDIVYLKDGSILRGQMQEYQRGNFLRFQIGSSEIRIDDSDILRIVQEPKDPVVTLVMKRERKPKVYAFREKGFYSAVVFALLPGGGEYRSEMGLSLQAAVGHQFNRHIGLGVGVSLDGYANTDGGDTFVPLFVEGRGYLFKKKNTPYWNVGLGYGFPFRTESANQDVRRFEGGYMFHPAIGYRLGADKTINLAFDLGYKFQKAITEREFFFSGEIITRDVLYRRLCIRASVIF
ncbi:hypothetical protein [Flavilitoribacter nigricans]|uniref:Uncharacterized protein n=1 Tax=Flavilitoribacter nigricans (strain ATCC 23147 / DSM 23189 / NBRC 102662 / NCIMB 1420 / SS-2) TaxID=1122177 RepID=A0A2D0NEK1_FLAN2|nr:hypothetical protein [Flavilitoribacter nigricans]PHN06609.1 hypothetical protein CRP01_09925 [Flavilitoribacter nigricans DSM 23189 = NBRC 102662]